MKKNLSLTKLLFEDEDVEGRLRLKQPVPKENLMSNNIISHKDIENILCTSIINSLKGDKELNSAVAFYGELEKKMEEAGVEDLNKLDLKDEDKS